MLKWVQSDNLGKCLRCGENVAFECKCYRYTYKFTEGVRTHELKWEVEINGLEELLKIYEDETKKIQGGR